MAPLPFERNAVFNGIWLQHEGAQRTKIDHEGYMRRELLCRPIATKYVLGAGFGIPHKATRMVRDIADCSFLSKPALPITH